MDLSVDSHDVPPSLYQQPMGIDPADVDTSADMEETHTLAN